MTSDGNLRFFLAYRRSETSAVAGRLYDHLVAEFGDQSVFFDIDQIAPGTDFVTAITDAVRASQYVLVLIGPDGFGERINDEHDFLRRELEIALESDSIVIPLLVNRATMPPADYLPDSIREITTRQALVLSHDRFRTGVDLLIETIRSRDAGRPRQTATPQLEQIVAKPRRLIFVSYAHADEAWLRRVQVHLRPLTRFGRLELWDDTQIGLGDEWRNEIRAALKMCSAAILLISADFMASDFIYEDELPPLLAAARDRGVKIVPVIVSSSYFDDSELAKFQALNAPSQPLDLMSKGEQEATLAKLYKSLRDVVVDAM